MKISTAVVAAAVLVTACAGQGSQAANSPSPHGTASPPASPSPSTSPNASTGPLTGSFGVLVTPTSTATYTISLVGVDGAVAASAQASSPADVSCANGSGAVVPMPVSTSNTRVYFMDAQGVVRFLAPNGDTGRATTVPIGGARRSMFAVSPDDQRIAVVVADFTPNGASTRLYVEDLNGGGHHVNAFNEVGVYSLWPTGWHDTNIGEGVAVNLVVAKVPACFRGAGPACCGPVELHVVDPGTAARRFTIGGSNCLIAGPPSPGGAVCESGAQANVLTWTATTIRSFSTQGFTPAFLSPDGSKTAIVPGLDTVIEESNRTLVGLQACGWIDDTHVFSVGDAQTQARVGNVTSGAIVPVAAQGLCAGRLPGGL